jgi:lipopolysaccharide transport system ATP-binding protein
VSHAPDAVKSLCRKGLFLAEGRTAYWGSAEEAVNQYFGHVRRADNEQAKKTQTELAKPVPFKTNVPGALRYGSGHAQLEQVRLLDASGSPVQAYQFGEQVIVEARIRAHIELKNLDVAFVVRDVAGVDLLGSSIADEHQRLPALAAGDVTTVRFSFNNQLRGGNYGVSMTLTNLPESLGENGITLDHVDGCVAFGVIPDVDRPVRHKMHVPVRIGFEVVRAGQAVPAPPAAVAG